MGNLYSVWSVVGARSGWRGSRASGIHVVHGEDPCDVIKWVDWFRRWDPFKIV